MSTTTLISLATSAFLAATVLPASSEALLAGLIVAEAAPIPVLLVVASVANTAGSCVNWLLGRAVNRFRDHRWFPVDAVDLTRAEGWYRRFGIWSLLASWIPIVGDPLTVLAGVMRTPIYFFLPLVAFAKTARYLAVVWLAS